jgi:hypothetical protein
MVCIQDAVEHGSILVVIPIWKQKSILEFQNIFASN